MVTVNTTRFGEISVQDEEMLFLPHGLIGFPELKNYVLLDHGTDSPFKWLQSLDDGAIAFVLINPLLFRPDYMVEVTEAEVSDLELENEDDAIISTIVTMPSNPENMTANLKAPLIFNLQNRKGMQLVLTTSQYTTRHNILQELKASGSEDATKVKATIEKEKLRAEASKKEKTRASSSST